jgi:xanthine dehydrogenase accessory factor
MFDRMVVVRGGGDLGSGVALRLWRVGFPVVVLESPNPVAVRRSVAFAEAVYDGCASVEEAESQLVASTDDVPAVLGQRQVPVLVDPEATALGALAPCAVVDAIMAKRNTGTSIDMAPVVIGLGPGFDAGSDVHAVVETNRGPHLGRVIWRGSAEPDTGDPASVSGRGMSRVLRAPTAGRLHALRSIGDIVEEEAVLATVNGTPLRAAFRGLIRGLAREGLMVETGMKIGDLDPRIDPSLCLVVSDKALAVAGGVLETILMLAPKTSP